MTIFDDISKDQLRELLVKNWMTHDGAWFFYTCNECGIAKANRLNKSAIKMLAEVEQKRLRKLMGWQDHKITTFEDLKILMDNAFSLIKGDFMKGTFSFPSKNLMHWTMDKCWAYEGMKKIGVEKEYECGVFYRVLCWIKDAGIKCEVDPPLKMCRMAMQGTCEGDIRFFLD